MGLESGWAHALGCPEWACLVRGRMRVFWGRGGGVRAAVAQYLRYLESAHTDGYLQIHAIPNHTCIYMQIHVNTYQYLGICAGICWYVRVL